MVNAFELPAFLQQGLTTLAQHATQNQTEISGAPFVLYHEPVNEQDAGAVELCLPVENAVPQSESISLKSDRAHREMFVTLSFQQVQEGNLMGAYEKIRLLMPGKGLRAEGSPREVYFNFNPAPEGEEAFLDVAFTVVPQGCCGGSLTCAGPSANPANPEHLC
ncbi:hypothetical protein GCM10008938_00180 [Deinococcus roseus]|uniref:Bacterial transcription activator effector binding domain-containing protein n=1 Tax=Deinococcus roseus TaxID=392414 RepID=A0ABQ2CSZ8_9DEIO|nr:hypothetical protein GCM10008938_00180 [Deinococcus roseus]